MEEPRPGRFEEPRIVSAGIEFSLYAPHAEAVDLCLFPAASGEPETERIEMARAADGTWRATAPGATAGQLYGFRASGPWEPWQGHRFNPAKLLVDPCAAALTGEPPADDVLRGSTPEGAPEPRDSGPAAPKSIVVDPAFEWGDDRRPERPWADTVVYECHVRGLTMRHPEVPADLRGTYLGLAAEPVIDHLLALGVTAVELLPVQQIASEPHLLNSGRRNYFGYSPLGFRAPHGGYATAADGRQVSEFKQMVKVLHEHGVEVILDLVFNHTAEGDERGRTLGPRGIGNQLFYRLRPEDRARYEDYTGCGNTLAAGHPEVAEFLVATLRYWVQVMHVDGFRFDLAACLGRAPDEFTAAAPFFELLAAEPWADRVKLIAEPWDLGPEGYQLGRFPAPWREWNDRFRDTARALWRGDDLPITALVDSVSGTPTRFSARRGPAASIDFVTCHDGFTLEDLVSYEHKHNWDNGEANRDGHDHNLSSNWGVEGPTDRAEVLAQRDRVKRNLLATLAVTLGTPMLLSGDELGRTQRGNNNAYCHDSELTWVDWGLDERGTELLDFARRLFAVRRKLLATSAEERRWLDPAGHPLSSPASLEPPAAARLHQHPDGGAALVVLNPGVQDRHVRLPRSPLPGSWIRRLSTAQPGERPLTAATFRASGRSIAILEFTPHRR